MFNAVRMDIYRLIHTKSAYVILVIAMAVSYTHLTLPTTSRV